MCEIVFREKAGAENVVATYNGNYVSAFFFFKNLRLCLVGGRKVFSGVR